MAVSFTDGLNSNAKGAPALQNVPTQPTPPTKKKKPRKPRKQCLKPNFEFGSSIDQAAGRIILSLPLKTVSEANSSQHWRTKHRRHQAQKNAVFWVMLEVRHLLRCPCTITFVRYAPNELDEHDNLPYSFKHICDCVCAEITGDFRPGRADNSKQIKKKYDQVKSPIYGVKIIIDLQ